MYYHLVTDAQGFITGNRITDGPEPAPAVGHIPVAEIDIVQSAVRAKGTAQWRGGRIQMAQDDRRAWALLRGRGHGGHRAYELLAHLREMRQAHRDDLPPEVALPSAPPRALPTVPHAFPEVPGLILRPTVADDLEGMAQAGIDGGLYTAVCPPGATCECTPPEAHAWLHLARRIDNDDCWAMTLEFEGHPLQFEIIREMQPGDVTFTYTVHLTRERPHWFWREAERPVFAGLQQHGIRGVYSTTRSDRPDWIQSLKDNYGAEAIEQHAKTTVLRYPLETIESRFTGWPARKAVGYDTTVGAVRIWEASAADLPAVRQLVQDTVPAGQRAIAARVLEEWWHLDRATVLLGAKDGQLRYARTVRHRKDTTASLAIVGALFDEPEQATMTAGIRGWLQQAGYTKLSSFVPERLLANEKMQAQLTRAGGRVVRTKTDWAERFTELEMDV